MRLIYLVSVCLSTLVCSVVGQGQLPPCHGSPCPHLRDYRSCTQRYNCLYCSCPVTTYCPPAVCPPYCQHGVYKSRDKNGCDVCTCRLPLCQDTPYCPNPPGGRCQERNGCLYCLCGNQLHCTFPVCPGICPYGTVKEKDLSGCEVCKCAPKPSCPPRPACAENVECQHGIKKINGCHSPNCECNTATCPPLSCKSKQCSLGFARETTGRTCPTCECRSQENSVACTVLPCIATTKCPAGQELKKERGCPICLCGPAPMCQPVNCGYLNCPHGFVKVNGCKTCGCLPAPVQCQYLQCPRKSCRRGFESDPYGCPTCNCNPRRPRSSRTGVV